MFGHRFGIGAAIAGDRDVGGQSTEGHEVDASSDKLDQAIGLGEGCFFGAQILAGVVAENGDGVP